MQTTLQPLSNKAFMPPCPQSTVTLVPAQKASSNSLPQMYVDNFGGELRNVSDTSNSNPIEITVGTDNTIYVDIETDEYVGLNTGNLFGRKFTSHIKEGENSGIITLSPDKNAELEINGLPEKLLHLEGELSALIEASRNFSIPAREQEILIPFRAEAAFSIENTPLKAKASISDDFSFNFSIGDSVSYDSQGRLGAGKGSVGAKAPLTDETALPSLNLGPMSVTGDTIFYGPNIGTAKKGIGSIGFKLQGGFDVGEFSNRVAAPLLHAVSEEQAYQQLRQQIDTKRQEVEAMRMQIKEYKPQYAPMIIRYTVPEKNPDLTV